MAISLSDPTIWSARILQYLDNTLVYKNALTNNVYEGEAKAGGKVKAFYLSDVSVSDYTGGWLDADWAELTDNSVELDIDQEKKIITKIPLLSQQFTILNLVDQGSQRIAYAIGNTVDQYIASLYTQVDSGNMYGDDTTPIVVGNGTGEVAPTKALAILDEALQNANAPHTNPRAVVPPWFGTMLEIELGHRNTPLGDQAVTSGVDGATGEVFNNISGFSQVRVSPNVPNTSGAKWKILAGDPMITYASAIDMLQIIQLQNDFAQGMKGLYVYGAKLMRGEYMALGTFNKGTY